MPLERLFHVLRLAFKSIGVHRLRSTLTILGIVLGVGSVIVMLAVGEAARYQAIQQIKDLGATNIIIRSVKPMEEKKETKGDDLLKYGLTYADMDRITSTVPTVLSATPLREFRQELRHRDHKLEGRVVGVMPNFQETNGLRLSEGRFLSSLDDQQFANVCVLGAETAETLFPLEGPLGKTVSIATLFGTRDYTVVGVLEHRAPSAGVGSSLAAQDYNKDLYIPFNTDRVRFGQLLVHYRAGSFQAEKLQISQLTVTVDSLANVKKTAEILQSMIDQYHTQKDVTVTVPLDLLEKAEQTQRLFTIVLGAIASISLVVGGIGIMNIMLASVLERIREIGVRRAMGATQRDVLFQFLAEAVLISVTGGAAGILVGAGLSAGIEKLAGIRTIVSFLSIVVAFGVSFSVGLGFGIVPAYRAAQQDPVECLRYE